MLTPAEAFLGVRYIFARRGNHFIAFMSLTSIVATALGVAVLLVILSIMNGFEGELRARILGMAAHLTVEPQPGAPGLEVPGWQALAARIEAWPGVQAVAPFVSRDVLVSHRGIVRAVELRGIDPARELKASAIGASLVEGELAQLDARRFRIVIGKELADALGVLRGDDLVVIVPQPLVTPAGMVPRMKRFEIAGIFEFGLHEHDGGLALIGLDDAHRLFRTGGRADGVRVTLDEPGTAPGAGRALADGLAAEGLTVEVTDWTQTHRNLFTALRTEKIVMFVILAIAIGIAAFNVVSILVMAVTEKRGDIAMLSALGMTRRRIMRVFLIQGALTGLAGILAGLAIGGLLALNVAGIVAGVEQLLGFKILSPDVYYISDIPSDVRPADFVATAVVAAVLALAAPLYPAWLATRTEPAEALRHE